MGSVKTLASISTRLTDIYKCGQYYECCICVNKFCKILHDLQSDLKEFSFANVLLLPPLDSFFDKEVQSLLGFHTLFYWLSPLNDRMAKIEPTAESTFEHWFAVAVYRDTFQLSYILLT